MSIAVSGSIPYRLRNAKSFAAAFHRLLGFCPAILKPNDNTSHSSIVSSSTCLFGSAKVDIPDEIKDGCMYVLLYIIFVVAFMFMILRWAMGKQNADKK